MASGRSGYRHITPCNYCISFYLSVTVHDLGLCERETKGIVIAYLKEKNTRNRPINRPVKTKETFSGDTLSANNDSWGWAGWPVPV